MADDAVLGGIVHVKRNELGSHDAAESIKDVA